MVLYNTSLTITDVNATKGGFIVDDSLVLDNFPYKYSSRYDSIEEAQTWVDNNFGSNMWRLIPNLRYNRYTDNVYMLEHLLPALEQHLTTSAKPLPTVYTSSSNTQISNTANIGGQQFNSQSTARQFITNIANNSPVHTAMSFNVNGYPLVMRFSFIALQSASVSGGKFTFATTQKYAEFTIAFTKTSAGKWEADISRTMVGDVPSSWVTSLNGGTTNEADDDPYAGDDPSDEGGGGSGGGGGSNYTNDSDSNDVPSLPTISASDTGFITLYSPSISQLKSLANYLWSGLFDVATFKKIMADPMDAILGLAIVPVVVPSAGTSNVVVGNIDTGVALTKASSQFVEVDCGTINVDEKWKAYLDYSPYTRCSIFLPYIGSQELDIDLIQKTTIGVKYHIDILSGACVAFITVGGSVIMEFSGQCSVSIPVTSQDFTQTIIALCGLVASGIGVVATGGMSAPVSGATIAGASTALANTAQNVASSKPTFAKSGNLSGSNGLMGIQKPYLIIERPRQCAPAYQNRYTGYPSYITDNLGSLSGFTQIQDIHLDGISCNDEERDEILKLLREGVIL